MKNLFTAPDIIDLLREKKFSLHLVLFMFLAGTILVLALIGAYHLTKNYFVKSDMRNTPTPTPTEEQTLSISEQRLQELGGSNEGTYDVAEAVRRAAELEGTEPSASPETNTKTMEDRLRELQ